MIQRLSILIIGLWVGGVQAQVTFTDVTDSAGITASGYLAGTAWGDYNNDGFQDLYLGSFWGDTSVLYMNNGNGTFTDVSIGAGVAPINGYTPAWADYDNDGYLDLFVGIDACTTKALYRNNGDGTFTDIGDSVSFVDPTPPARSEGLGIMDYDADGDIDIFIANNNQWTGEPNLLLRNDNGIYVDVTAQAGIYIGNDMSRNAVCADYDNDGDIDFYVSNYGLSRDWLYRNNGDGTFTEVSESAGINTLDHTIGAAWGDYNNDGNLDFAYAAQHVPVRLYRNNGDGTFTECAGAAGLPTYSLEGQNVAWADYDNDGYLDLYMGLENEGGIYDKLYRNDGDGTFTEVTSQVGLPGAYTWGVSWADYDNDGDLDLQRFDPSGHPRLYRNDGGNTNHWLELNLVGDDCNRAAIGARARIVSGGMIQIREVSGMTSEQSQNSLTLEFGLGSYTQVDTLEVRWPCGRIDREFNIAADQIITRVEGWSVGVEEDRTVSKKTKNFTLSQAYPNPFSRLTVLGYQLPVVCDVYLKVYNVNGQLVKTLSNENKNPGVYKVIWDGKDDLGRQVSSGIYFIRLEAGDFSSTKKVLRLR
ncbi:MAG: FG-GAP-like repeat-containing protein [Candidatus Edwardsbacteria bacterium]